MDKDHEKNCWKSSKEKGYWDEAEADFHPIKSTDFHTKIGLQFLIFRPAAFVQI